MHRKEAHFSTSMYGMYVSNKALVFLVKTLSSKRQRKKAERIKKEANIKCPIVIKSSVFY